MSQEVVMSVPRLSPPVPSSDAASAVQALRDRGLRITAARRLVIEGLYAAGRPVTAEELASGMYGRFPRTDLASVYRNLETLEDAGIVHHMHLGHGPGLYAPAADAAEYVACERCGRSQAVPAEALDGLRAAVRAAVGYAASFAHFPVMGLCPTCQEKLHVRSR
jgi:Fur family transcriptional regulator, ferric uptake regulator